MAESEIVQVEPSLLKELIDKIALKRADVEKELSGLGKAPKDIKDILHQCRGFERAFNNAVDSVEISSQIRRTFNSIEGLTGAVDKLPVEQRFQLANVKQVCREADGYQAHLVSPEFGLRRLVQDAMDLIMEPTTTAVRRVHLLLVEAARQGSRNAAKFTEDGRIDDKRTGQLPAFEQACENSLMKAILAAAQRSLERWKESALANVSSLVEMERDFVTAAFFRHAVAQRSAHMQQLEQMHDIMDNGGMRPADDDDDESEPGDIDDDDDDDDDESTVDGSTAPAARQASSLTPQTRGAPPADDEFKMGYLEKRIGEHSGRQNLPESWKWQKRWFVMTDAKGMLYYFKTADDPPNYRGVINLRECRVDDMDSQGNVRAAGRGVQDSGSVLIKLSHRDPNKAVIKKHNSLVLRAESPAEKYSWLVRLKRCAEGAHAVVPGPNRGLPQRTPPPAPGGGGAKKGSPPGGNQPGYQQPPMPMDKESFMDGNLGLGMAIPEDATAALGPLPHLIPTITQEQKDAEEVDTSAYDAWLEQLSEDTKQYVRAVFKTLVATVPKAIIHAQVKMAQENLLPHLYTYASSLTPIELEAMLNEDPEHMQKRAAAQLAVKDMNSFLVELRRMEDQVEKTPEDERPPTVPVAKQAVVASGLWDLLPGGRPSSPYGDYTPRSMQGKTPFTENGKSGPADGRSARPAIAAAGPPKPRRRPPPAPPGGH